MRSSQVKANETCQDHYSKRSLFKLYERHLLSENEPLQQILTKRAAEKGFMQGLGFRVSCKVRGMKKTLIY